MDLESAENSAIEALSEALERLQVPTFNIKMVDAIVQDYPESSTTERFMQPRYSRTQTTRGVASVFGAVKKENDSPIDKLRPEGINPFGIYLDLDCNPDISSTLDRWETSIRLAIAVNRMTEEDGKRYIGMPMIKSASQFWHNLNPETKASALEGESLTNILTNKIVHLLRT